MTKPIFDTRISLGNLIHIVLLVGSVVVGATWALSAIDHLKEQNLTLSAEVSSLSMRVRQVETTTAMQGRDFKAMDDLLGKVEVQLSENNRLLRQLLSKQASAH